MQFQKPQLPTLKIPHLCSAIGWPKWVFLVFAFASAVQAAAPAHTQVSLVSEWQAVAPGESFDVGIRLKMDPGWHTYWKDPGDSGLATSIEWKLPKGFVADPIRWPKPMVIKMAGLTSYAYEEEVLLLARIHVPAKGYRNGQSVKLEANVEWLECAEACVPGSATVSITLRIVKISQNAAPEVLALFEKYRAMIPPDDYHPSKKGLLNSGTGTTVPPMNVLPSSQPKILKLTLWEALFGAFLGGMILNLMPCVLPVIAIKILSFVKEGSAEPQGARKLGLIYGAGVLASFWGLALLVIALQTTGRQVGWGSVLFQEPRFLMIMALVVTAITLNFFGVFEVELASGASGAISGLAARQGSAGAFFNGVLATTLATPCTAPFLGPAVGFAFTQPPLSIFLIFTAVAVGLALPYVILVWNPKLLKWIPKPGMWMIRFKQAMGFLMLATVIWLVNNLASHDQVAAFYFEGWLVLAAFAIWLVGTLAAGRFSLICLVLIAVAWASLAHIQPILKGAEKNTTARLHAGSLIDWQPYTKAALAEALKSSQPVFVDFTADWCLTCQVNKRTSLEIESVAKKFKDLHVIAFLADWTKRNDEIMEAIRSFDRPGVPLYVLYPTDRGKPAVVLPEVLTPKIVLDALTQ